MKHKYLYGLTALVCATLTAHATPKPVVVPDNESNAEWAAAEVKGFDTVRIAPEANLTRFKTFLVLQPTLEFDKHWLREFKTDMSKHDEERLRESYTRVLRTALEDNLSKSLGWQRVEQAGSDTLVVAPSLTRFRLNAPDLSFRPRTKDYVHYAGSARLELRLSDGGSGVALAELADHSETRSFGGLGDLKPTNRTENLRDFKMLSKRWAVRLSEYLAGNHQPLVR